MGIKESIQHISILGCGWLGKIISRNFIENGSIVEGSYRNPQQMEDLELSGIIPRLVDVKEDAVYCDRLSFFQADILIVALPPRRVDHIERMYPNMMRQVLASINKGTVKKVIFISSTSVYPENGELVTELDSHSGQKSSGKAVLAAEKVFRDDKGLETIILRAGGLIGPGRLPGSFVRNTTFKNRGNVPVNLVFGQDVASAVLHLIKQDCWNETYNVVAPMHPLRLDLYTKAAQLQGIEFEEPVGLPDSVAYKVVSPEKLMGTGFVFQHPDLIAGLEVLYQNYDDFSKQ